MPGKKLLWVVFTCLYLIVTGSSQLSAQQLSDLQQILPVDPHVKVGQLENGLKYYIRENHKPENRAELRLVVNVGSILEEDDQRGIAHFVEHMAFNGTKHFAKQEIVNYLESIGMRFGPDINAYTSFDETVYMLQIPTDRAEIITTAFQILEDWAHLLTFDKEEVEKERKVVIEEWRLGRGAMARMRDKQFPVLFKNSRYADRLPIGKKEILEKVQAKELRKFYKDWYRPDLMAVIAVGDFDSQKILELIVQHFAHLKSPRKPKVRKIYPVPDHQETLFAIATDPEATSTSVSIYFKQDVHEDKTIADYLNLIREILFNGMFNARLSELIRSSSDPPFIFAFSNKSQIVRAKEFYILGAVVKENGILRGLETLLTEALRLKKYGFTETELQRQKAELLRGMEIAFNERDKTESSVYAAEYIRNFLTGEPFPGVEYEYKLHKKYLPKIKLDEINALAKTWITDHNRVVMVNAPEKPGLHIPTEAEIRAVFEKSQNEIIKPYADVTSDIPLLAKPPQPGKVVKETYYPEVDVTEWQLSNGVRVVLKPTDFKNDEVLFEAFSPGGHSLAPDEDFIPARTATSIINESGVGKFDRITLEKKLAGKAVRVSPWIGSLEEGMSGGAAPRDLEAMFKLIYLYFTEPRVDSTAFLSYKNRLKDFIANRHASPEAAFQDTIQVTMAQYHPHSKPWSLELIKKMDLRKSFEFYQDRFADASDFTFILVGNFTLKKIRPFVETYLGSLPAKNRKESWRDVGIRPPKGVIEKTVWKGLEPKSRIQIIFSGPFQWSRENRYLLQSMASVFQIRLREVLREEKGGTYGVSVWAIPSHYPLESYQLIISFACDPDRVEELTEVVFTQIKKFKFYGIPYSYVKKVKEIQRRERETNLKENNFWLNILHTYYFHNENPEDIVHYGQLMEKLTPKIVQEYARKYFNEKNFVKVVLYPEKGKTNQ